MQSSLVSPRRRPYRRTVPQDEDRDVYLVFGVYILSCGTGEREVLISNEWALLVVSSEHSNQSIE